MTSDLRVAFRTLLKSPGFALIAIAALALGIGANTAIFSVVNQVLLNPAGVSSPERVAALRCRYNNIGLAGISVSVPDFAAVEQSKQLFEYTAIFDEGDFNYTGHGVPERLQGASVTASWFDVFGVRPIIGRVFTPEEDQPNANQVIVLSYGGWTRLFGRDAGAIGRTLELNGKSCRIVGVMGPAFRWPARVDLWAPMGLPRSAYSEDNTFNESHGAYTRLKPGVSVTHANAYIKILNNRVRNSPGRGGAYAKASGWGTYVMPFTDFIAGNTKTPMLVLMAAVGFVLLIACSNIAGLMLARASGRAREIAVRAALGANRWNLIRQPLMESLLLSFCGAAVGLGVAYLGTQTLLRFAPEEAPVTLAVSLDPRVLLFTLVAAIVAGILFGIAPAWQVSRLDRFESLKEGGRSGAAGLRRQHLRSGLVIGEVALALVLLVGAGLFLRSLVQLQDVNPGFNPHGVMTALLSMPDAQYHEEPKRVVFLQSVVERLAHLPGVTSAAAALPAPFAFGDASGSFSIEGRPRTANDPGPHGNVRYVTPDYFTTLKIPLRRGRWFTDQDRAGTQPVMVIDENLAREYWPNEDPVGKHMRQGGPWATIIGVVGHVMHSSLDDNSSKGTYYYAMYQQPAPFAVLLLRTPGDPVGLAGAMRDTVLAVDSGLPIHHVRSMESAVMASLGARRFIVTLLGFFAVMAMLLAVLGLYGVISYSVTQRTQEIGIRMALGAQRREVLRMVVGQGMRLAGIGAVFGFAGSVAFSRLLHSQLFAVSPFDPLTFAATAAVLVAAALLASYIPAMRATRVDPMDALRYE